MIRKNLYFIMLILFVLQSCGTNEKKGDVLLSGFTKDLISLYIKDIELPDTSEAENIIILETYSDSSYYYLSIFANNPAEYNYCRDNFMGTTMYNGYLVKVFGEPNSMFFSNASPSHGPENCNSEPIEYDPIIWEICFNKDSSFCKMKTCKANIEEDISDIQDLAEKYFKISTSTANEVYQSVENAPKFAMGDDAMRRLIAANFKQMKVGENTNSIPIVVEIIVDEKGHATIKGFARKTNDKNLDNEALRVAHIICQHKFIPAKHRGQVVKATSSIFFTRNEISSDSLQ